MPSLSPVFKIAPTNWDSENTNLTTTCGRLHTIRHTNCMNLRNSAAINSGSGSGNNNDVGGKINCVFLWRVMRVKWKVKRLSDNVSRRTVRRAALPSQQICIEAVLQQIQKTTSNQASQVEHNGAAKNNSGFIVCFIRLSQRSSGCEENGPSDCTHNETYWLIAQLIH